MQHPISKTLLKKKKKSVKKKKKPVSLYPSRVDHKYLLLKGPNKMFMICMYFSFDSLLQGSLN